MNSELIQLNKLHANANGVFCTADEQAAFNYSDGAESEQRLHQILTEADDLSSESLELAGQIVDWPTEYHLSPTRANLLRPLNLDNVQRVLELGCGCGSITRYLSEAGELLIDAVEGSPVRAELAALRCRGLDNVTITTGNFNDLVFPEHYYDLVLLVGVAEYAGRYSKRETDQQALQDLLSMAKRTAKADGVVLIAIENRVGLKYMMGACEDHYGVPYVGIQNYPESTGIRTYSKSEWQLEIEKAGFAASRFIFPLPDYKIPTLLVGDLAAPELLPALAKVKSRDYTQSFELGEQEQMLWRAQAEAGTLGEFANSFLILLSDEGQGLALLANFDLAEYPQQLPDYLLTSEICSNSESDALREHARQLQQKADLITGSRGWHWLNKLRALVGKPTIKN